LDTTASVDNGTAAIESVLPPAGLPRAGLPAAGLPTAGVPAAGARTAEAIGRIWIAPYVDEGGVYHEARWVRAVLEPARWRLP